MYLDIESIFYFIVLPILGLISMIVCIKQQENEMYKLYDNKKNQYNELYEKYKKLYEKYEKLKKSQINNNVDETKEEQTKAEENIHIKKCDICGSIEDIEYFPTSGYIEKNGSKTYLSGGVKLCKNCLNACEVCSICNKLIPTEEIKSYINELMQHPCFCSHIYAHSKVAEIKKKYNI